MTTEWKNLPACGNSLHTLLAARREPAADVKDTVSLCSQINEVLIWGEVLPSWRGRPGKSQRVEALFCHCREPGARLGALPHLNPGGSQGAEWD